MVKLAGLLLAGMLASVPGAQGMVAETKAAPLYSYTIVSGVDYRSDAGARGRLLLQGRCPVLRAHNGVTLPVIFEVGTKFTRKSVKIGSKLLTFNRGIDRLGLRVTVFPESLVQDLVGECVKPGQEVALLSK